MGLEEVEEKEESEESKIINSLNEIENNIGKQYHQSMHPFEEISEKINRNGRVYGSKAKKRLDEVRIKLIDYELGRL